MHIVHILKGKANPETLNGVNKIVHWMATGEQSLGHDVEVWGITATVNRPRTDAHNYKLRLFSASPFLAAITSELKQAIAALDRNTWVHFHSAFIFEYPTIVSALRRKGLLYGITPHGCYSPGVLKKNRWRKRLYLALRERRFAAGASWAQATGRGEIEDILAIAPHLRVELIPNGQERDLLAGVEVPLIAAAHPVIGYCGRFAMKHKGLDYLLQGFSTYKSKGGNGELWLVGDGDDRAKVERMAADGGVQSDIKFFGAMSGAEKLKVIANFDVFIHSSRWEGLPMACLEAAALGKPLLVSRETNLAGYVEDYQAGLVLDETSAAGVERALDRVQQLYANRQIPQLSENARSLCEKEFSWEENAKCFTAVARTSLSAA
jgi:glycosyltransferase involved in cell wall biosynthesis